MNDDTAQAIVSALTNPIASNIPADLDVTGGAFTLLAAHLEELRTRIFSLEERLPSNQP